MNFRWINLVAGCRYTGVKNMAPETGELELGEEGGEISEEEQLRDEEE
jgi:hypothetical protein